MSEIKVNSIKGVGASAAAITVNNTDGTCTANLTNRTNKNLVTNGAMIVAQRGQTSTTSGYGTVDRFASFFGGTDEDVTQEQVDVASGTTPYRLGFRKALKQTNGNQTSGAGTNDNVQIQTRLEAQDLANSGWNYTSSSSFITFSFWCKSSVAQNFYGYLRTKDGTEQRYAFETGSLTADTWTKITKTIAGNSNLQFDNNSGQGLEINISPFFGTAFTDSGVSLNAWGAYSSGTRMPDYTSTWYTTNDATFELTGVQLEVGSIATDFEHRSFGQELALCQRYYYKHAEGDAVDMGVGAYYRSDLFAFSIKFPVTMRATPTLDYVTGTDYYQIFHNNTNDLFNTFAITRAQENCAAFDSQAGTSGVQGSGGILNTSNSSSYVAMTAEL